LYVNPGAGGVRERFPGAFDIDRRRPTQRRNDRAATGPGDLPHGRKIVLRGDREPGFNDVHAERVELPRHA
jgi:hypothetical protein